MAIRHRGANKRPLRPFEHLDNLNLNPILSENYILFFERVGITNNGQKEKRGMRGLKRKIDKNLESLVCVTVFVWEKGRGYET